MSGNVVTDPASVSWEPSQERLELGEALRRLLDVVVRTGAEPSEHR
jgi:hypothetical protein